MADKGLPFDVILSNCSQCPGAWLFGVNLEGSWKLTRALLEWMTAQLEVC